ncbi:MBL fold metallo-hydrolase [Cryptosporangium phraense]|uniref:MBL fold metallo-hydrolase n=1 Tax=Cryptosporangium phraense TaxID=2593070 RepID=UPI00197AFE9F|nr:MBL fold metallo-hydrolase [Cryptosporangium phraense]
MNLTILGNRAGMPANGQPSSGYLVTTDDAMVLLDCGPGVATALSAITTPDQLSAIVVSHLHLDHCYDVLPLGKSLLARALPSPDVEIPSVPLYVPVGATDVLRTLADLFRIPTLPILDRAFDLAFDVREYRPGDRMTVADLEISLTGLRHSAPNCWPRPRC